MDTCSYVSSFNLYIRMHWQSNKFLLVEVTKLQQFALETLWNNSTTEANSDHCQRTMMEGFAFSR